MLVGRAAWGFKRMSDLSKFDVRVKAPPEPVSW